MNDTESQTAGGKVIRHVTMSLDGFVAGLNHTMNRMTGMSSRPGLIDNIEITDAMPEGRDGWDLDNWDLDNNARPYGGGWKRRSSCSPTTPRMPRPLTTSRL